MMNNVTTLIVAAGRGTRAGEGGPKQYRLLDGIAILARTAKAFLECDKVDFVRIIIHRDDRALYDQAMKGLLGHSKLMEPVFGGKERQDSVRMGLESLSDNPPEKVLIHDAARPFIDGDTIGRVIDALDIYGGAIAALPVFDTLKRATDLKHVTNVPSNGHAAIIEKTISRESLWRAQTPQGFTFNEILSAHRKVVGRVLTDDAAVAETQNIEVALIAGSPDNMKITQAEDFGMAQLLLRRYN